MEKLGMVGQDELVAGAVTNLIGAYRRVPRGARLGEIINPADGRSVLGVVHESAPGDVWAAINFAKDAFLSWRAMPMVRRCRILFHCKALLEQRLDEIATCLVAENGKTLAEAQAEVRRGIEVLELACGMPSLSKGDFFENIAPDIDGIMYREPLGVVAGICPFNFPAMIPMWMFPIAIACGNTFILKPSDTCPLTANLIADVMLEGGLPAGVLNIVQGAAATSALLCDHPDVEAISIVGSTVAAREVYRRATDAGKRCQALGGAKNHLVVMPDADLEPTVAAIAGSAFGGAGERCMAASIVTVVGDNQPLVGAVVEAAGKLRLGNGLDPRTTLGPVISAAHKERVERYVQIGIDEGAVLLRDGRGQDMDGYFVGPCILDNVTPDMQVARTEIFGPVLSMMHADDLDHALVLVNSTPYGNGASIFTASGAAAHRFRREVECGMLGINAGVPAPMAFISFGGRKNSFFGDLKAQGTESVAFYTKSKSVIERWFGTGDVWGK